MTNFFYIYGAVMFVVVTVALVVFQAKLWRSDSLSKLERSLEITAGYLVGVAACGLSFYIGWNASYPTTVVNGRHRTTAPEGTGTALLAALYVSILLAVASFATAWWVKKRRLKLANNDEDRIWAALYAEYGWTEARRLYESYRRRMQDL